MTKYSKNVFCHKLSLVFLSSLALLVFLLESCDDGILPCARFPDFRLVSDDITRAAIGMLKSSWTFALAIITFSGELYSDSVEIFYTAIVCPSFARDFFAKLGHAGGSETNNCYERNEIDPKSREGNPASPFPRHIALGVLLLTTMWELIERFEHNQKVVRKSEEHWRDLAHDLSQPGNRARSPARPDQGLRDDPEPIESNDSSEGGGEEKEGLSDDVFVG